MPKEFETAPASPVKCRKQIAAERDISEPPEVASRLAPKGFERATEEVIGRSKKVLLHRRKRAASGALRSRPGPTQLAALCRGST